MAIKGTVRPNFSEVYQRVNSTNYTVTQRSIPSTNQFSGEDWTATHNSSREPFGLGDGLAMTTAPTYVMPPVEGPVVQFIVINDGPDAVLVGINNEVSGTWNINDTLTLASGESFEFGEEGTQVIRNIWGRAATDTSTLRGYATNLKV